MANFVLVHGTGCGGWVWQKLEPLLRSRGHDVYTPTLTGLADRKHLFTTKINLTTHIDDVCNLIFYEDLSNVVLVGNSYAGMVISGVAARIPERLKLLVYLDAYLPDDGQSEADLLPKEMLAARRADAATNGGLIQPPPPGIFGITDTGLAEWVQARMTHHPFLTYTEPVHLGDRHGPSIPSIYIHCVGNPSTTPDLFSTSAAKALARGWPVIRLKAGHLAMLSQPQLLTDVLHKALESELLHDTHSDL